MATPLARLKYRIQLRMQLQKADKKTLDITNEELHREYERRNKEK